MGSEARARVGLLALVFIVLLSFNQLFGQQEFAGPSLLGILIATGVALGCRRIGLWPSTTIAVSVTTLVWYVVLIFQAPHTFYGLPTLGALQRVGAAVTRAYEQSQIDYAPVPLRPGYAILTVVAMWMIVTIGEVATFRWRRPLLASIGPIALFSLLMVVGTRAGGSVHVVLFLAALFTYWALESAHRLRSWGRWVPVWKGRTEEPPSLTTGLARRMGVSCVAAALVVPVFLPALEEGLLSWRSNQGIGGFGSGFGPGVGPRAVNPLVSLVPQLIEQTDQELFRVQASEPAYWRLFTLGAFNGVQWRDATARTETFAPGGSVPLDVGPPSPGRLVRQSFTITGLGGNDLPVAGMPITVQSEHEGDFAADPATADLRLDRNLEEGFTYQVDATVPDPTFKQLNQAGPGFIYADSPYLQTGPLSEAVQDLVTEWTAGAQTPLKQLTAIQSHLRAFDYDYDVSMPVSSDYLEEFLLRTRVGYCQQFATAFALLARHLGFPARVVVGFLPGETDPATPNNYSVTGEDTHAWPEVLFEGFGWIRFEPTPRGESPEPTYTYRLPPEAPPTTIAGAEAPTGSQPGQRGLGEVRGVPTPGAPGNPREAVVPRTRDRIDSRWQETFARIAAVLLTGAIAFIALVPLLKRLRIRRGYAQAKTSRATAAAAFREFQLEAAELFAPRLASESARAYARRVGKETGLSQPTVLRLASIFEAAEFAPIDPAPEVANEARRLARQLRRRLWAQAGWFKRLKRLWSPGSLVGSPARGIRRAAMAKVVSLGRS